MDNLLVIILAAGKGTRMKSTLPKVCHKVGGIPMITHVVSAAKTFNPKEIVVVVSKENISEIKLCLEQKHDRNIRFIMQNEQLGTAHAVISAIECCHFNENILVLMGDVPLINDRSLNTISKTNLDAVIMGFNDEDINNKFGRIVLKNNLVHKIVEYNDATDKEREINLCNSGILWLKNIHIPLLYKIDNNNAKKEYYLTDIVKLMNHNKLKIGLFRADKYECMGINTKDDLNRVNGWFYN